jgi:hypothetical protein
MGPMQFLPGTWARYASDGDGDGVADPQNLFDATLAAARYLCSGGLNLRDANQVMAAILRYNNSVPYAQNVLGWAAAYATGVVPVDLPAITGTPPPLGDAHLEHQEGLGPSLPLNAMGLPGTDPFAGVPLIDFNQTQLAPPPMFPWMMPPASQGPAPLTPTPGCTLICIGPQSAPPGPLGPGGTQGPSGVFSPFPQQAPPNGMPPFQPFPQAPPPNGMPPFQPFPQAPPPNGMPPFQPLPPFGAPPQDPFAPPPAAPPPADPAPSSVPQGAGPAAAKPSPARKKPAGPPSAVATNAPPPGEPAPAPPG